MKFQRIFMALIYGLLIGSLTCILYEAKQKSSCVLNIPRETIDGSVGTIGLFVPETVYYLWHTGTRENGEVCEKRVQVSAKEYERQWVN